MTNHLTSPLTVLDRPIPPRELSENAATGPDRSDRPGVPAENPMSIFHEIRAQCAAVAARARFVRIDRPRLEEAARRLAPAAAHAPLLDPHFHYVGDRTTPIAYIVPLGTVNSVSGCLPHLHKPGG